MGVEACAQEIPAGVHEKSRRGCTCTNNVKCIIALLHFVAVAFCMFLSISSFPSQPPGSVPRLARMYSGFGFLWGLANSLGLSQFVCYGLLLDVHSMLVCRRIY